MTCVYGLCQISKNTYYDYQKKNKKYVPESQEETEDIFTSDLLQNFSDKETAFQVHQVLHRLSEPYKEVFSLRVFGELSFGTISSLFGKSESWARVTYHRACKKSGRNWIMKISCNIIEDLLPLYVDDMVSEDSRQLVEEHLKECTTCQKMMEEMKKENSLGHGKEGLADAERKAIEPLKKIRRKIRRKRIAAVLMAAVLVAATGGIGHYWYYDKKSYISWEDAGITVRDGKIYAGINPTGRLSAVVSVDQKNMFYMMSETAWTRKEYPADIDTERELWDVKDLQEAHDRGVNAVTDETSMPSGIEKYLLCGSGEHKRSIQTLGLPG